MSKNKNINNFGKLFILTFVFNLCFLLFSESVVFANTIKNSVRTEVTKNKIISYIQVREIVSWWPRIKYEIKEKKAWEISFPSIEGENSLLGPTEKINNSIYFAYENFVLELDTNKNQIVNRYPLSGEITDLSVEDGKINLKLFNGIKGVVWDKEKTLSMTPKQLDYISNYEKVTDRNFEKIYVKRNDAKNLSTYFNKVYINGLIRDNYSHQKLGLTRQEYINAIEHDITNPWYYIYLALMSENLGKKEYAYVYFQKSLDVKNLVFYDYFQLSTLFEYLELTSLADTAYEKGLKDFLERGYLPEQLTSIQSILNYSDWLIPAINKLKVKNSERMLILMDRFYTISPFKEGNFNITTSIANYFIDKGRLLEAKDWKIRAGNSRGFFFPGDYSLILADFSLNLFLACIISFVLFAGLYLVRDLSFYIEHIRLKHYEFKKFLYKRYFSKENVYSIVILYGFSLLVLGLTSTVLGFIGNFVSQPFTVNSGTWGNYSTVKYFSENLSNSDNSKLFLGISHQQLKDYEGAKEYYNELDSAIAYNNLGIIYLDKRDKEQAKKEFEKALLLNPYLLEAEYNLSLLDPKNPKINISDKNEKVNLYKKYIPGKPMMALPNNKDYKKAYYGSFSIFDFSPMNIKLFNNFLKSTDNELIEFTRLINPVFILFTIIVFLMLIGLFVPHTVIDTKNHSYLRRLIGIFIPGFSYNWKIFGPFIFALWLGCGITTLFFYGWIFDNPKPAIGLLTTYGLPDYSSLSPGQSNDISYSNEFGFVSSIIFCMIYLFNLFYVMISKRYIKY